MIYDIEEVILDININRIQMYDYFTTPLLETNLN